MHLSTRWLHAAGNAHSLACPGRNRFCHEGGHAEQQSLGSCCPWVALLCNAKAPRTSVIDWAPGSRPSLPCSFSDSVSFAQAAGAAAVRRQLTGVSAQVLLLFEAQVLIGGLFGAFLFGD